MAERIRLINPECNITCIEDFVTPENVAAILLPSFDVVIDAIDQTRVKAAMIAHCRRQGTPIVVAGAAGGLLLGMALCALAPGLRRLLPRRPPHAEVSPEKKA